MIGVACLDDGFSSMIGGNAVCRASRLRKD